MYKLARLFNCRRPIIKVEQAVSETDRGALLELTRLRNCKTSIAVFVINAIWRYAIDKRQTGSGVVFVLCRPSYSLAGVTTFWSNGEGESKYEGEMVQNRTASRSRKLYDI